MIVLALMSLTGCDALTNARDTLDGILNPLVVEGIVLGIEAPQGAGLGDLLGGTDYQAGTSVTLFMADAAQVDDLENAPVSGAIVELSGGGVSGVVNELEGGIYAREPNGSLPYVPESVWTLTMERSTADETIVSTATLNLPADADYSEQIPAAHTLNTGIDIDFTGLGYDAGLVVVIDESGIVYSNEPSTIREVYDFTHGDGDLTMLSIPPETFDSESIYLVGVAGMVNTRAADLNEMNTALSTIMAGKMNFYAVSTVPIPVP